MSSHIVCGTAVLLSENACDDGSDISLAPAQRVDARKGLVGLLRRAGILIGYRVPRSFPIRERHFGTFFGCMWI